MTTIEYEFLTVADLKAAIANLPDDCPVLLETPEWPYLVRAEQSAIRQLSEAENYRPLIELDFGDEDKDRLTLFIK